MKRLFWGVGLFFFLCGGAVLFKTFAKDTEDLSFQLIEVEISDVNETASCDGSLRAAETEHIKLGKPAEITELYVSEGDSVLAGDTLFCYRPLSTDEIDIYLRDIAESELDTVSASAEAMSTDDVLEAAEFYAANGRVPDWFQGFYLPPSTYGGDSGTDSMPVCVRAGIAGTVTELNISEGDCISGFLNSATVSNSQKLVAEIEIPQNYIGNVMVGQYANISSTAFSGMLFSASVSQVSSEARTVGSLLGNKTTVVDGMLTLDSCDSRLIPGLSVRADIFINSWKAAAIIPYSALCRDSTGEFVWQWRDGTVSRVDIEPVYKYSKGAVVCNLFFGGELLISNPNESLCEGMTVSGVMAD